jgi:tetratricopeptide (TPR) repeat protein
MSKIGGSSKIQRLLKESSLLCHSGNITEAKKIYQDLLELIPNHPEVLGNLGTIELQEGNTDIGVSFLNQALKTNPTEIKFIINLGNGLMELKKFDEALSYYQAAEKLNPNFLSTIYNKARALKYLGRIDEAIISLKKCLSIDSNNYLVLCDLAFLKNAQENFQEALELYTKAISINPKNFLTFYNRGIAFESIGQFDEALKDYNQVIKENPFFEPALFNKCGIFTKQKKMEEALNLINYLLKMDQGNTTYYIEKAFIYEQIKNFDLAINSYNQALLINPNSEEAMTKKGFCLLRNDQFQEGWSLSENRWGCPEKLQTSKPELLNFNVVNKKILIWAEQGIGDQIIFSGLFQEIFSTKNFFYVSLDPRLINLYGRSFSWAKNVNFISQFDILDENLYDYQLPITSVGKFFRNSIYDFESHPKAYLKSDKTQVEVLKKKFNKYSQKICGISWFSKNSLFGREKSLSLDQLLPILRHQNTIFVNLQYGDVSGEIEKIADHFKIEIISFSDIDNFNDLDGLASLIDMCDYIVTTSNVTAHIAGALNKITFLMLPFSRGKLWYWGNSSDRSLWYPSIEIFRASDLSDWDTPINNLSNKLKVYYE